MALMFIKDEVIICCDELIHGAYGRKQTVVTCAFQVPCIRQVKVKPSLWGITLMTQHTKKTR